MENVTGKIVKCGAYPIKDPKPFTFQDAHTGQQKTITNTHRLSIQLDEGDGTSHWYGLGNTEKDAFIVKDDAGQWKVLGAGSDVLIKYELSPCGKYRNAKKSGLTILNLVEGKRFEKEGGGGNSSSAAAATPSGGANPAEVGQCINLTQLSINDLVNLTDSGVAAYVEGYKQVKQRFTDAFNAKKPEPVAAPTPQEQGHAGNYDPDFDDDIPF